MVSSKAVYYKKYVHLKFFFMKEKEKVNNSGERNQCFIKKMSSYFAVI